MMKCKSTSGLASSVTAGLSETFNPCKVAFLQGVDTITMLVNFQSLDDILGWNPASNSEAGGMDSSSIVAGGTFFTAVRL